MDVTSWSWFSSLISQNFLMLTWDLYQAGCIRHSLPLRPSFLCHQGFHLCRNKYFVLNLVGSSPWSSLVRATAGYWQLPKRWLCQPCLTDLDFHRHSSKRFCTIVFLSATYTNADCLRRPMSLFSTILCAGPLFCYPSSRLGQPFPPSIKNSSLPRLFCSTAHFPSQLRHCLATSQFSIFLDLTSVSKPRVQLRFIFLPPFSLLERCGVSAGSFPVFQSHIVLFLACYAHLN